MSKLITFFIAFAILIPSSFAATIHVPGNYATIQAGVNAAANGDTVLVGPGTYTESVTIQNVTIHLLTSNGPDATKIIRTGSGLISCLTVYTSSEIRGFTLERSGAYLTAATLQVLDGSPLVHHNLIKCIAEGVICVEIAGSGSPQFLNNTLYGLDDDFNYGFKVTSSAVCPTIKNNIVYLNPSIFGPEYGIYNQAGAAIIHTYNDFYQCTLSGTSLGLGEIQTNPLFVGGSPYSYHLQSNSPCIDTGVPIFTDPDFTRSDMGCFYYDQGTLSVNVTVTLTPDTIPVQIPASGGSFDYNIAVANPEAFSVPANVWFMITLPSGVLWGPIQNPINVNLNAGFSGNRDRTQFIRGSISPGSYTYHAYIGLYPGIIWDHSCFGFEKLITGGESEVYDWYCTGESFDEWQTTPEIDISAEFNLRGAYPNPFNPSTAISYQLSALSFVNLAVYDLSGRKVAELVNGWRDIGSHEVTFDASDLSSGMYLYKLHVSGSGVIPTIDTGKMVLMK